MGLNEHMLSTSNNAHPESFCELLEKYSPTLRKYATELAWDMTYLEPCDAEDLYSEGCIKVYRTYFGNDAKKAYVHKGDFAGLALFKRVLKSVAIDLNRKNERIRTNQGVRHIELDSPIAGPSGMATIGEMVSTSSCEAEEVELAQYLEQIIEGVITNSLERQLARYELGLTDELVDLSNYSDSYQRQLRHQYRRRLKPYLQRLI